MSNQSRQPGRKGKRSAQAEPTGSSPDASNTGKGLAALHAIFVASGCQFPPDRFAVALEEHLRKSPDPGMAVAQLRRFLEAVPTPASLLNDLLQYPPLLDLLLRVFGASHYFADILVREPGLFRWLTASDVLLHPRSREALAAEVDRTLGMFRTPEKQLDALKRLHRRELLRIGTRDLLDESDLTTTTAELSLLADMLVQACLAIAAGQLSDRFPRPAPTPVAVIGLGKLGGGELNYSSDIDLLVVYGDEGEFAGARRKVTTHQEYVARLVERMVRNLTEATAEGHLYRVDMRLRPEGNAGPLARSLPACMAYYEARGELWERQMLIKARPVAGDREFGALFVRRLEPFVYPRTLLQSPSELTGRIKARIEAAVQGEENIKLRSGGIRDVEFAVQVLQLLNGGKTPAVRSASTLDAIARLVSAALLSETEARALTNGYLFLRKLEHMLQMMENTQTHTIPGSTAARAALARRVGYGSADELLAEYGRHTARIRKVFDQVLSTSPPGGEYTLARILEGNVPEATVAEFLGGHGFRDPRASSRSLATLLRGESLTGASTLDARLREAIRGHAGELLRSVAAMPSPDITLANLARLAEVPALRGVLYRELDDPAFRNLLVALCGRAPRFARAVAGRPPLLDTVIRARLGFTPVPPDREEELVSTRTSLELGAGVRYALDLTTFDQFSGELTRTADVLLGFVFERQAKRMRLKSVPLVVCALGKYGTGEMTLDADLDLIFVGEPRTPAEAARLETLAGRIVSSLSPVSGAGRGYVIDLRLRPEGRNAPLVVERESYLHYLQHRASLWERQSLTRFRVVCGSAATGDRVLRGVREFVYRSPLPPGWTDTVVEMRKRMESRSRVRAGGFVDIKLGPGGMADVEFLAQMLLLSAGPAGERYHAAPAAFVLEELPSTFLSARERSELVRAYRWYRSIEALLRIVLDVHGSVLPEGEKLEVLSLYSDGTTGSQFAERCTSVMASVRRIFLESARRRAGR